MEHVGNDTDEINVNISMLKNSGKLTCRQLWPYYRVTIDFMALLLHETIPGHHLQVRQTMLLNFLKCFVYVY
jgi:hypothetical protein